MLFFVNRLFLLCNLKLIIKNRFIYLKVMQKHCKIYFKLSSVIFVYVNKDFIYFLTFFIYMFKVKTIQNRLYDYMLYNYLVYRILFFVNGYNCRMEVFENFLVFYLGFSHSLIYKLPSFAFISIYDDKFMEYEFYLDVWTKKLLLKLLVDLKKIRFFNDVYGGKGIFLVKEVFKARKTKKQIKK